MKKLYVVLLSLAASASITFAAEMEIYPQISAQIVSIAQAGASANKGDVLVKFDDKQIQAKINEIDAIVKYKKVVLDDVQKNLDETKELYQSTVAPKRELDIAIIDEAKARNDYNSEVAKLNYYKLEKEKYTITAPFNATVKQIVSPRNATNIYNAKALMVIESK